MQRLLTSMLTLALIAGAASSASAKTCRDAHGHFMKCKPAPMMMHKAKMCRDAHGHFMKCGMPMHHM